MNLVFQNIISKALVPANVSEFILPSVFMSMR
jgi:hypothetical protein